MSDDPSQDTLRNAAAELAALNQQHKDIQSHLVRGASILLTQAEAIKLRDELLTRVLALLTPTTEQWQKGPVTQHKALHKARMFHVGGEACVVCALYAEIVEALENG